MLTKGICFFLSILPHISVSAEVSIVLAETTSDNPTSIRLNWNAPPNQKCPINSYVVSYRLVRQDRCLLDDDWPVHELAVVANHGDVEIDSLIPFSTYELKVFAVTEAGNGSMSVVVVQTGETSKDRIIFVTKQLKQKYIQIQAVLCWCLKWPLSLRYE